jgi:hypothetical protein
MELGSDSQTERRRLMDKLKAWWNNLMAKLRGGSTKR